MLVKNAGEHSNLIVFKVLPYTFILAHFKEIYLPTYRISEIATSPTLFAHWPHTEAGSSLPVSVTF